MTENDFLQEILANPDDEGPRLIFADWLEERGDPRGEFIRVQCELAGMKERKSRRRTLKTREGELLAKHEKEWLGPLQSLAKSWEFRRGFVARIKINTRDFIKHGEKIFQWTPVQEVFLTAGPRRVPALAVCPFLARLKALEFNHTFMGDE